MIYAYDLETIDQSSEYRLNGEAKPKPKNRCVVHYEFVPTGQTVNKEYYLSVMLHLRKAILKKRSELWANNSWILQHDNAPSHIALFLRVFFAQNSTHVALQPPYSPDLAPCSQETTKGKSF